MSPRRWPSLPERIPEGSDPRELGENGSHCSPTETRRSSAAHPQAMRTNGCSNAVIGRGRRTRTCARTSVIRLPSTRTAPREGRTPGAVEDSDVVDQVAAHRGGDSKASEPWRDDRPGTNMDP